MLEAQGVWKVYHAGKRNERRALEDVNVTVTRGSCIVLTGASGSGKTTLLALLGALDRPTRGRVLLDGRDLGTCSEAELARTRQGMGFLFQDFALIANLPIWENVTYALVPRGVTRGERHELARQLLTRLELGDRLTARPHELSGGEQQRVAAARALAGDPAILLADEPTSNLDARTAETLVSLLHELHRAGKTIILSSHDPRVLRLAGHICTLEAGRLTVQPASIR